MSAVDEDQIADWSQEIIGDLIACEALRDDRQSHEETLKLHDAIAKTLRHIVEWVAEEAQERVAGHVSWSPIIHPDFDKGFLAGLSHGYHLGEEGDERRFYMSRETYLARVNDRPRLLALYEAQRSTLPAEGCDSAAAAQSSSETDHV